MDTLDQVNQILSLGGASTQDSQASDTSTSSGNPMLDQVNQIIDSNPEDVTHAQGSLGSQADNGLCQKFVEDEVYGRSGIFPTAKDAWSYYSKNNLAKTDTKYMKPGSLIYFAPDQSNNQEGHVGIYAGDGTMVSATNNGVKQDNIGAWQQQTGQQILGYVAINK